MEALSRLLVQSQRVMPTNLLSRIWGRFARTSASRHMIRPFARAFDIAVSEAEISLHHLPRNEKPLRRILQLRERAQTADIDNMDLEVMHAFIDELQLALSEVHSEIFRTWFEVRHPAQRGAAAETNA